MIRAATSADVPALLELGQRMHLESPRFSRLTFCTNKLRSTIEGVLGSPLGFLQVVEIEGELAGVFMALASEFWDSTDLVAFDLALYVEPAHRGGLHAVRLVRRYLAWADEVGAVIKQVGVSTGVHTEQTARLYEAMGMRRFGVLLEA